MEQKQKVTIAALLLLLCIAALLMLLHKQGRQTASEEETRNKHSPRVLRFGHNINENSAMHLAAKKFADLVAQRSHGRLEVQLFPNQALGNDHQMVEMARAGELDIVLTPTAKLSTLVPPMQYADLPFLFPSRQDAYALLDGEVGTLLLAKLPAYGLVGVTFWENGFKHFTANKAIHRPEDFRGLNIRVMKSPIIVEQFKAFHANPIPIDFHQTYQALHDGVVDGQENPLVAIYNMRLHEVQSHLILSRHAYLCYVLSFSKQVFEQLDGELQKILVAAALELTPFERQETMVREETYLEKIQSSGTRIIYLTPAERESFRAATAHIIDDYRDIIGHDILEKTRQYLHAKYSAPAPAADRQQVN